MSLTAGELARTIDHTLLKPYATREHISGLCARAREYNFRAVCINPYFTRQAARELAGSGVHVCTVVGFPLGAAASRIKAAEALAAVEDGAAEIDFVINIGELKGGSKEAVEEDILTVVNSVKKVSPGVITKCILETCLLDREEKISACKIAVRAGVDFVKTSTGFASSGATVEDVQLLKEAAGPAAGVKASGGIKDLDTALAMLETGAGRLGTSSGVDIIKEALSSEY